MRLVVIWPYEGSKMRLLGDRPQQSPLNCDLPALINHQGHRLHVTLHHSVVRVSRHVSRPTILTSDFATRHHFLQFVSGNPSFDIIPFPHQFPKFIFEFLFGKLLEQKLAGSCPTTHALSVSRPGTNLVSTNRAAPRTQ